MYIQNDPRRWWERADGSMVMEDKMSTANLSPKVMISPIPHHSLATNPSRQTRLLVEDQADTMGMSLAFMGKVKASRRL